MARSSSAAQAGERRESITHNSSDFVSDEPRRLIGIRTIHEEVILETPGQDRQHEVPSSFHTLVTDDLTPHFDGIRKIAILRRGLLVFAVTDWGDTMRP